MHSGTKGGHQFFLLLLGRHFPRDRENQLNKNSGKFDVFMSQHKLN
jgi:hypothetical protein